MHFISCAVMHRHAPSSRDHRIHQQTLRSSFAAQLPARHVCFKSKQMTEDLLHPSA
jgi:hypothetical protein